MNLAQINISGVGAGVVDVLSDPPASQVQGADYGVGQNATGAWEGHEGKIARADASQVTGWLMIDGIVLIYTTAERDLYDKPNGYWEPAPIKAGDPGPAGPQGPQGPAGAPGGGGGGGSATLATYDLAGKTEIIHPITSNSVTVMVKDKAAGEAKLLLSIDGGQTYITTSVYRTNYMLGSVYGQSSESAIVLFRDSSLAHSNAVLKGLALPGPVFFQAVKTKSAGYAQFHQGFVDITGPVTHIKLDMDGTATGGTAYFVNE